MASDNPRMAAYATLEKFGVAPTEKRVRELAKAIAEHGDCIRIELVTKGGNMRSLPGNAAKIGRLKKENKEIWAYWD